MFPEIGFQKGYAAVSMRRSPRGNKMIRGGITMKKLVALTLALLLVLGMAPPLSPRT
jgi:hypothetical protein